MPEQQYSEEHLKLFLDEVENLSTGSFKSWYSSSLRWILGGGTTIALADWWIRWWSLGV
jgi:hypothetical protein